MEIIYRINEETEKKVMEVNDIPHEVKLVYQEILDFSGVKRKQLLVPQRYCNLFAQVRDEEVLVEFDEKGRSYSRFIPTLRPDIEVKIHYKGEPEGFFDTLEELEVATDFCDSCGHPLKKHPTSYLTDEGEAVAEMYYCEKCASYSLRFHHDSLRWYSALQHLIREHEPQMEKDYAETRVRQKDEKAWTTPQQRLGRSG